MPTRVLMSGSALCFGVLGLGALFVPERFAPLVGLPTGTEILVQLIAAGLLSVTILNWAGRGAIYGGIYGRPIVLANFAFGMVGGGSLLSTHLRNGASTAGWALTSLLVVYTAGFARLLFANPTGSKGDM